MDGKTISVLVVFAVAMIVGVLGEHYRDVRDEQEAEIIELAPVEFAPERERPRGCMLFNPETDAVRLFVARAR